MAKRKKNFKILQKLKKINTNKHLRIKTTSILLQ